VPPSFRRGRFFKLQPIRNTNWLWWPCFLSNRDEMRKSYRGPTTDASYTDAKWWQKLTLPFSQVSSKTPWKWYRVHQMSTNNRDQCLPGEHTRYPLARTRFLYLCVFTLADAQLSERWLQYRCISCIIQVGLVVWFMVFNATFKNISVISWRPVLLEEESRVPGENNRPVTSHWQTLSHNVVSSTPCHEWGSNSQL
jgi:hypothetical protein